MSHEESPTHNNGDFLYLDPPYKSERSRLYFGRFDHDEFFDWLRKQRGGWALSMNGPAEGEDFVPEIYDERYELPNGTSAVRRLGGLETPSVTESLFVRRCKDENQIGISTTSRE